MQTDKIGALDEIVNAGRPAHLRGQSPGRFDGNVRVVADDIHAELDSRFGQFGADGAQADNAQRAAPQFVADEALFARLDLLLQRFIIADQPADEAQCRKEIARAHQHAGDHQFLDGIGVSAGCIENDDALFAHRFDRNVISPSAGASDAQYAGGDRHFVHILRTDKDGIRCFHIVSGCIAFGQASQSFLGNGVERQDFTVHGVRDP